MWRTRKIETVDRKPTACLSGVMGACESAESTAPHGQCAVVAKVCSECEIARVCSDGENGQARSCFSVPISDVASDV